MPTIAKPQLIESESPWGAPFDRMYLSLCQDRVPVLAALERYVQRSHSKLKKHIFDRSREIIFLATFCIGKLGK
jgi:hypothetical protein